MSVYRELQHLETYLTSNSAARADIQAQIRNLRAQIHRESKLSEEDAFALLDILCKVAHVDA